MDIFKNYDSWKLASPYDDLKSINENVIFEDYQFIFDGNDWSVDGVVSIVDGNIVDITLDVITSWSECDQEWILANDHYKSVHEFLDFSDEFINYVYSRL